MKYPSLFALVAAVVTALPAQAAEFKRADECTPGRQVVARDGKAGVVVEVRRGMCVLRLADGSERSSLHWMLRAAGDSAAPADDGLTAGAYSCSATGAGSFAITVQDGGRYVDRAGQRGQFSLNEGQEMVFASGSLVGQYARRLGPGKFGLSSVKGKSFYTVCNLKLP